MLAEVEQELAALHALRQQKAAAAQALQLAEHEVRLVEARVASSAGAAAAQRAERLRDQLQGAQAEEQDAVACKAELEGKAAVRLCCATCGVLMMQNHAAQCIRAVICCDRSATAMQHQSNTVNVHLCPGATASLLLSEAEACAGAEGTHCQL